MVIHIYLSAFLVVSPVTRVRDSNASDAGRIIEDMCSHHRQRGYIKKRVIVVRIHGASVVNQDLMSRKQVTRGGDSKCFG